MKTKRKDITDSVNDQKKLEPGEFEINLPDVKDIPGQENITVPPLGELADTTISSADEEGEGILDEFNETTEVTNRPDANVTKEERQALRDAAEKVTSRDQAALENAKPDQFDEEGDSLNERSDISGNDLDVPGSELDDDNEEIGEEDEENNSFSLPGEEEDKNNERQ